MTTGTAAPFSPAREKAALDARDLYRFFRTGEEETLALRGVSLQVRRGETVAVVGPSGSGKSTLLACLAGLDEPAGGFVHVGGERISHRPEVQRARLRARRIGVLLQSGNLIAHLDVRENIRLAQAAAGRRRTSVAPEVAELLDAVGLSGRSRALPHQLAGGELARAGLAVALANDPDVLLADEPTGELDGRTEQRVLDLLGSRSDAGRGVLVVTHNTQVVGFADRVLVLRDGRIQP
ncbi:ABC transporter ATP-binding protein [Streptomyces sp. DASNCL29]|uniref:ABC transporter ATP-binding protein n=1 Tax=Streptomyces sp. DASNCL29 TaxID=2583819 RepID=UPI00110FA579|nr:ABC transporter ATP-binding protein [Streptomyces sp. DASNCL29]TMU92887.1 ABC transporter ATP-binding protein [Streptomyces sp. DASNCL29]